ncbi:MAG: hypothetical protein AAGD43_12510, partial [Pseudomonadota bacterium]
GRRTASEFGLRSGLMLASTCRDPASCADLWSRDGLSYGKSSIFVLILGDSKKKNQSQEKKCDKLFAMR